MNRFRIGQLITELEPAGAERCVYELARRLDKRRFDVEVIALRGGRMADMLADAGVRTHVLGVRGKWDISRALSLTGLLRRERYDILHTHLFHADMAGRVAAYLTGTKRLVHTVHVAEGRFRPWQFAWARILAGRCDRIICVSQSVRDFHARRTGLPPWRYTVIRNGVDAEAFSRDEQSRARLRTEWGISGDRPLVAFVGRLDRQKGIDTLLSAMSHLGARGDSVDLVMAGDGPQRGQVKNFIRRGTGGQHCRWLGFTDDVRSVFSAADVFVMPSRWEGMPLAALEAMAAGLAVIGSRVAGLTELIVDGQTGVLIEPNDGVALANAIAGLVSAPEDLARLGTAAKRSVIRDYSIAVNISRHEALYADIVGQ